MAVYIAVAVRSEIHNVFTSFVCLYTLFNLKLSATVELLPLIGSVEQLNVFETVNTIQTMGHNRLILEYKNTGMQTLLFV